ncbi:MAG: hypothetical protein GF398_11395 [Chitinivibrionales bacterium]|nr:hypothetical protein [Chitinivibrionales bacterium]
MKANRSNDGNVIIRRLAKKCASAIAAYIDHPGSLSIQPHKVLRIAYFIGGGIGDGIMSAPALALLGKTFTHAQVDVLVPRQSYPVLAILLSEYRVAPFHPERILLSVLPRWHRPYDLAFTNTIAAFKMGIEYAAVLCSSVACGFRYSDEGFGERLYSFTRRLQHDEHDRWQNMLLIRDTVAGVGEQALVECSSVSAQVSPQRTAAVVMHPGVARGYALRLWPVSRYREIVERLRDRKVKVKVLFGPAERYLIDDFEGIAGNGVELLVCPGAQKLVDTISEASLFVGNDSGPGHIAALVGTPGISLFGPADPARSAPQGPAHTVLYTGEACSPCHFKSAACRTNNCMQNISVDRVWEVVVQKLFGT